MTIQSPAQPPIPPSGQPPVSLLPTNPLGVGDLIDRSFRLYRRNFKTFLYMAAVLLLPYTIVSGFFTQSMMQNQLAVLQQVVTDFNNPVAINNLTNLENTATLGGWYFLLSLAGGVLYLVTYLGLVTLAIRTLNGATPSLRMGFAGAGRNFWATVRLMIIFFLVFIGMAVLMFLVFAVVGGIFGAVFSGIFDTGAALGSGNTSEFGAILGVLFAFCCVVPLAFALVMGPPIYLVSRWSVTMPALVDNEPGARRSMRISWELTRGRVWRVIGYFALVYLLSVVIFALPFYIVQFGSLLLLGFDLVWLSALIGTVISALLTTLWLPMTAILPTMLYFDLRTRDDLAKGRGSSANATMTQSAPITPAGQPTVSTPPYAGPTWAPESPPASPTGTSTPATPQQTPASWSQNDEPDDPWASPRATSDDQS